MNVHSCDVHVYNMLSSVYVPEGLGKFKGS